MAKILAVLYPDPVDGYPKTYARDDVPKIDHYPDGQTVPDAQIDRLQTRAVAGQRFRRARVCASISKARATRSS